MITNIITYPTIPSQAFDGVVRHYDEALHMLLQDLKDTMEANQLDGLAAYQIGSPNAVMIVKDTEGHLLEIINPIILTKEGNITPVESTAYYPRLTATTKRYAKIKLMYEDRNAKQHFLEAEDDLAILIQRKTDYLLGSDFRVRMDEAEKRLFDAKLSKGDNSFTQGTCPTREPKTIKNILRMLKATLVLGVLGIIVSFFVPADLHATLYSAEKFLMLFMLASIITYVFVAYHEGKNTVTAPLVK